MSVRFTGDPAPAWVWNAETQAPETRIIFRCITRGSAKPVLNAVVGFSMVIRKVVP